MVFLSDEKAFIALFGWVLYSGAFVTLPGLLLDTVGAIYTLLYFGVLLIGGKGEPEPRV